MGTYAFIRRAAAAFGIRYPVHRPILEGAVRWHAQATIAAKAGVKDATIRDLKAGRTPKSAPRDELAIYAFVKELYVTRRVRNAT